MYLSEFYFTQHSLKAFRDCPLKFKKRYVENIRWEEPPEEDIRKYIQLGRDFHILAQRYFMGIKGRYIENEYLTKWQESLEKQFPLEKDAVYLPEFKIRMRLNDFNIEANFDLIVVKDEQITIWDWKTGNPVKKGYNNLKSRNLKTDLQTKVYMYVLKEQAGMIAGKDVEHEKIKMLYWQPEPPGVIASMDYTEELHRMFYEDIINDIKSIINYDYESFDKSLYLKHCKYCEFNCFCNMEKIDYAAVYMEEL